MRQHCSSTTGYAQGSVTSVQRPDCANLASFEGFALGENAGWRVKFGAPVLGHPSPTKETEASSSAKAALRPESALPIDVAALRIDAGATRGEQPHRSAA